MVKLSGSISRKVPIAGIEFSSQSYSAGLEVEVSDGESPEAIKTRIRDLYALLSSAIDEQIAVAGHRQAGAAPNGNGGAPTPVPQAVSRLPAAQPSPPPNGGNDSNNGNGGGGGKRLGGKATQAQQRAVYAICKSLSPPEVTVPKLEATDNRDDYCTSEGDGLWISPFIQFIEGKVAERAHVPGFQFSQDESLDEQLLAEITSTHVRALLVEFINAHYRDWRDGDVEYPDYDDIRDDSRDYCSECDSGWEEIHGEYDGPRAEQVPPDENEEEAGITEEERQARHLRNLERRRERTRRREAQEEAESEVVDRSFICEDDCDGFCDYINEHYRDAFDPNTAALERRWEKFLADRGEKDFPPLISTRR
ncbi:MAG: hypothetical protein NTW87_10340 [Planctomycetota bacterium]|nr:hypothetical protein [Planctomycetota bacterium]